MAATIQIIANLQNNAASPIKALREDIEGLGTGAEKSAGGFSKLQAAGAVATGVLVAGITGAAVAMGSFLSDSVRMAADMEAQVSNIAAVWDTTAQAISPVKDLIQDLGLDPNLKVTAEEAALAIENLAKNGLTMDQVLQGAAYSTVLLANATGADFGTAANVASDVMALFNIKAEDMKTAVDGITSVTVASKFAIDDYAMALAQGGGVAAQLGVSFADFNTALVATASYFKSGSDAGTSFKTFIQRLVPSTKEATEMMKSLGIITDETGNRFYDAEGNMQSMAVIAGVLNETISGLSEEQKNMALTTMFGSDALRFAGAIAGYTTEEFLALQKVMGDTDALEQAKTRVDNFRGAWEIFMGVIDGLKLQIGSALLPALRMLVEFLTGQLVVAGSAAIDIFENIIEAFTMFGEAISEGTSPLQAFSGLIQQIGLIFGLSMDQATALGDAISGIVGVVVGAVTAFAGFIGQFVSWKDVLAGIAVAIGSFVIPLLAGLIGGFLQLIAPVLATIAVISLLRNAWESNFLGIRTAVEGFVQNVINLIGVVRSALSGDLTSLRSYFDALPDSFQKVATGILQFIGNLLQLGSSFGDIAGRVDEFVSTVMSIINYFGLVISEGDELNDHLSELPKPIQDIALAIGSVLAPTFDRIKEALSGFGDSIEPVKEKLKTLWQSLLDLGSAIGQALLPVLGLLGGALLTVGKFLGEVFAGLLENAGKILGGVVDYIIGQVQGLTAIIQGIVNVVTAILQGDWAGAWEAAKQAVSNWVSAVGTSLSGLVQVVDGILGTLWNAVVNTINDLTGATLPSWEQFKQSVANAFTDLVEKIKTAIAPIVDFFAPTIERIKEAFAGLGDSFAPVGAKLGELKDAFTRLGEALQPVLDVFQRFASFVGSVVLGTLQAIGAVVGAVVALIAKFLGEVLAGIINNAATVIGGLVTAVTGIVDGITNAVQSIVDFVRAIFQGDWAAAWEAAKSYVSGMVETVKTVLIGLAQSIDGIIAIIWDAVVNTFNDLTGAVLPSWEEFKTRVTEVFNSIPQEITASVGEWLSAVSGVIQAVKDALTGEGSWSDVGAAIMEAIRTSFETAVTILSTIGALIRDKIFEWAGAEDWSGVGQKIMEMIGNAISTAISFISEKLSGIQEAIFNWAGAEDWSGVGQKIIELIGDAISAAVSSISEKLSGIREAIFNWAGAEDWSGVAEAIAGAIGDKLAELADAVADGLSGWQEAIFNWAEAEDWAGVAEHIAESVGDKLGELGDTISDGLSGWQEAIFNWAEAEDWAGVAEHIAESVGEKLGDVGDTIKSGLESWKEAIFDWVGGEDFSEAGESIVMSVVEGLGNFATEAAGKVEEWLDAINDTVSSIDWYEIGYTIAYEAAQSLGEFAAEAQDKIEEWGDAITGFLEGIDWQAAGDAIMQGIAEKIADISAFLTDTIPGWIEQFKAKLEGIDWKAAADAIIKGITDKIADISTFLTEVLPGWIEQFKAQVEGMTWDQIALLILGGIIAKLAGINEVPGNDLGGIVTAWKDAIVAKVQEKIAEFQSIGGNIIAGIAEGIANGLGAIQAAIQGIVNGAIAGFQSGFQEHSPSRVMMPIGFGVSEGIAVGITQGAGTILSAIGQVAEQVKLEGVKAFAEAVQAIGEAIETAVHAYILMSGFGGADTGSVAAGLASIVALMATMVDAFTEANVHAADVLELTGKFADTAGAILELIVDSLLPLRLLASIDLGFLSSSALLRGLWALRDFLVMLVSAFAEAAAELGVMGSLIEAFAAAAESIVGLVEDSLRAIMLLSGFNFGPAIENWHLAEQIVILRNILQTMVREFAEAALEFAWMGEAVETFTSAAESIISLVEDSLRAVVLLSGFNFATAVQGWHLAEQIVILRNILRTMVREFVEAALEFSFMGEAVEAFTSAAESVVGLVEDSLKAIMLLSGFNFGAAVQGWHLADQIVIFRNIIRTMVREFAEAAGEFGGMSDAVSAFAEAAEGVIGIVEDGLAAAVALSNIDFGAVVQGWHLADQIVIFRNIIRTMVREFAEAAGEFGSMADSVQAFAEAGGAVVELVESGLKAVEELSAVDFGALVQGWHLAGQIETFRNIIRTMMREFAEAAAEFGSLSESVQAFAEAAGAVVDLIEPGIEAIKLLANYSADTSTLAAAMQKFTADIVALTLTLASGFQQAQAQIGQSLTAAAEFAEAAGKLVDIVEPGIEALAAIAGYEALPGIRTMATAFAQQLVAVLLELALAFAAAATNAGAVVVQAADFSESAASILDIVEPGIDALVALATYAPIAGIRVVAAAFGQQLVAALVEIANALSSAATSAVAAIGQAATFADSAAAIIDVIVPGIEALVALTTYVPIANAQAAVTSFAADLVTVITLLVQALQQSGILANAAVVEAGEMASSMSDLVDVVAPAVEAVVFLVGYTQVSGLRTFTQQFAADLAIVITTLVDGLRQAGLLANAAVAEAGEMAKHLEDLLKVVDPALDGDKGAIPNLLNYTSQGGLKEKTAQFVQDLITVVQTLVDGLTQSALATGIALQKAGEMAKNIEDLFKAVSEALDVMNDLAEYKGAGDLAAKVQKFTGDLIATATILVTNLTAAATQLGGPAIAAAQSFATSMVEIAQAIGGVVSTMDMLAGAQMPPIKPILDYIIKSAGEIAAAAQASGSVGNAGASMAQFADAVEQVVAEVMEALEHLAQLASANTPGSIQGILDAMANALRNAVPSFGGAGEALAGAVEDGFRSGDYEGAGQDAASAFIDGIQSQEGEAVQAASGLISAMLNAAEAAARLFIEVGKAVTAAIISGIQSTASAVTAAVVKVLTDAINAARSVVNQATTLGQDVAKAAAAGMVGMRSTLDSAGVQAGSALIEGLRRAIASGQSSVVNQIIATVRAAVAAAQNALGIHSPSKVFYTIGRFLSDGFRLGVEAGMAPVIRAVDRFARNVSDTMSAGLAVSVPSVRLSGNMLAAPVSMSGVTPKYRIPQPVISPPTPPMARVTPAMPHEETTVYNEFKIDLHFPGGTSATPADIRRMVQEGVDAALLKSGRKVDASRRLK